eukprot:4675903-Pleurochrysis_carterae.AAC.4
MHDRKKKGTGRPSQGEGGRSAGHGVSANEWDRRRQRLDAETVATESVIVRALRRNVLERMGGMKDSRISRRGRQQSAHAERIRESLTRRGFKSRGKNAPSRTYATWSRRQGSSHRLAKVEGSHANASSRPRGRRDVLKIVAMRTQLGIRRP